MANITLLAVNMIGSCILASTAIIVGGLSELKHFYPVTPNQRPLQVCTDCPRFLLPFHVKSVPHATCATISSLKVDRVKYDVWDEALCPSWCLNGTAPTDQLVTGSGVVEVRECRPEPQHS